MAKRLLFDLGDEIFNDRQRDIGLEQGNAHFAQRVLNIRLSQTRLTAQRFDNGRQPLREIVEHDSVLESEVGVDFEASNCNIRVLSIRLDLCPLLFISRSH